MIIALVVFLWVTAPTCINHWGFIMFQIKFFFVFSPLKLAMISCSFPYLSFRRLWSGVSPGAVWFRVDPGVSPWLHLLRLSQHGELPGSQLPGGSRGNPGPERARLSAKQQDPATTAGSFQPHHRHALALLQQYLIHPALHIHGLHPPGGARSGGQQTPPLSGFWHFSGPDQTPCSAPLPLWPNHSACWLIWGAAQPAVPLFTGGCYILKV